IAAYAPTVRQHFDLPQDRLILCAISFGYADDAAPINRFRTQRATPEDIIDWKS
ncbi:MAG TPA: nitroreductase, partial [Sulfitobacter pontiacus]|nr:nitroreductase [Sulfitobacter pontiacus]